MRTKFELTRHLHQCIRKSLDAGFEVAGSEIDASTLRLTWKTLTSSPALC
jgi:hypothetical protein